MNIAVIGLGKLGAPMAAVFASKGHFIKGADLNAEAVRLLHLGLPPVEEAGLESYLLQCGHRITATTDTQAAAASCDIVFVIVPTPSQFDGRFSSAAILSACYPIGRAIADSSQYKLVVITSTVSPGQMEGAIQPALEAVCERQCGDGWGLCYNPEFIALGTVIHDMEHPDFVLVGESDTKAGDILEEFYGTIHNRPVERMNFPSAEIAKITVNLALTLKISLGNSVAEMCEGYRGADCDAVTGAVGSDERIGPKYLRGGLAFGGPCFPRDGRAWASAAKSVGAGVDLAAATDAVNRRQAVRLAKSVGNQVTVGATIGIVGLSYKPGTPVVEESPSLALIRELLKYKLDILVYDRQAMLEAKKALGDKVRYAKDLYDVSCCDVLVLAVPDPFYIHQLPAILSGADRPAVIIDPWRALKVESLPVTMRYVASGRR